MKIINGNTITPKELVNRVEDDTKQIEATVEEIIKTVREKGDEALFDYTKKFDKVELGELEVTAAEIAEAEDKVDENFKRILSEAKANVEAYHKNQIRKGFNMQGANGVRLGQRVTPIENVGIYVPGGTASYPSTVIMNAVPAKIAGVKNLIMVTPSGKDKKVAATILVAAKIAGVDRIFKLGGAQAVAALAYGTESVPKVDKIVGPGNIFVATAKKQVFGAVSIDMIAGPSEILVVADEEANPIWVAADLLSQAEHDKRATAILITTSKALAQAVDSEVEMQLKALPREEIARASIESNGKIIIVDNLNQAIDIANAIAPEHLELCVKSPFELFEKVENAGSVFLGNNTPEAVGDYFAGANHTLPTSGTARFSSALSVDDFVKKTQYIAYTDLALKENGEKIIEFAKREGLQAHGEAIAKRLYK